jgi:hypothetical protein
MVTEIQSLWENFVRAPRDSTDDFGFKFDSMNDDQRICCQSPMFVGCEFRDINEYQVAFASSPPVRPKSKPEQRPWLEAHLDLRGDNTGAYPSSEPAQTLMHWAELRGTLIAKQDRDDSDGQIPPEGEMEEDQGSPYLTGFRHSMSLDFGALETLES